MIHAVLDVNVMISATIASQGISRSLLNRAKAEDFTLVLSAGMIEVVAAKLQLPRIGQRYGITSADIDTVVASLFLVADVVDVPPALVRPISGDPEDDFVLATCVAGEATHLVTGDKPLRALHSHGSTSVMLPREFVEILDVQ